MAAKTTPGTSPDIRLIDAAFVLAKQRRWQDVTMIDIATAAGLEPVVAFDLFRSKADLLRGFVRRIDRQVLADLDPADFDESGHDRLISVMMARFDALAPYRAALNAILRDGADYGPYDGLRAIKAHFGSMRWMLDAAGFATGGVQGSLRVAGLGGIYARCFRQWLRDETADFGPTMAALDRALSGAAQWDKRLGKGISRLHKFCDRLSRRGQSGVKTRDESGDETRHETADTPKPAGA